MHHWNDGDLLSAYANRQSEEAFGLLVERHVALVYSAALRQVQKPHLAQDVTQATFTILAQKAGQLSARATLSGWLCCTAHFVARNALKAEFRRNYREHEAHVQSLLNEPDPQNWRQLAPLLDEAVAQLNEADRNAVVLRFYERKPLNEVGAILKMDPATAQKRVSRALDKLRKFFASRGVNSTPTAIAETISAYSVGAVPVALAKTVAIGVLTKGAAASTSTLTLVKGALKIMAWTKAKMAIAASAGALLAVGTVTVAIKKIESSHANAIFEEIWAHPEASRTMDALIHAPPAVIVRPTRYPEAVPRGFETDARIGHGFQVNTPLKYLVMGAYQVGPWRTVFLADTPGGGFDLMQTLPPGQNQSALQKEIRRQFGLVGHMETRAADALQLVVKDSKKLNSCISQNGPGGVTGSSTGNQPMRLALKFQTSKEIAGELESYFRTPVIAPAEMTDHYDLTFRVDYKLQNKALEKSFRDQLDLFGLELVPTNAPIEMLVVEKAK